MKIYCLSGLGADKRVFETIELDSPNELVFIEWIPPLKGETLRLYSKRLFDSINFPADYTLLGLSFGGMVAVEMSKLKKPNQLILISSIEDKNELPFRYKMVKFLKLHQIIPLSLLKSSNFFTNYFFGTSTSSDKELLKNILRDTDYRFLKWALNSILNWENITPVDSHRIHGAKDKILPNKKPNIEFTIKDGGHFMIKTKSEEISRILNKLFESI